MVRQPLLWPRPTRTRDSGVLIIMNLRLSLRGNELRGQALPIALISRLLMPAKCLISNTILLRSLTACTIWEIVLAGGFKEFRRATETPFNRIFEAKV